jgi:pimeloyl-ACP methyl ester carboxylesterase
MTWSQREFIQLSLPTTASAPATNSSYRLYKFTDQRDPRQQQLHINPKDFCTKSHDNTSIVAVMYVPGHGGSYEQSRSLGAHGVQMTGEYQSATEMRRAQHYLQTGHRHGEYEDADNFVFDVYAVHFAQEPTGLHGRFLHHQADYLARAIAHIAKTCALTQIYVVAHSLGGYVARLARIAHPSTRPLMRNLITLATPHDHVVLSYEATIRQSHDAMMRQENADDDDDNLVIISIAGGLRDGLIPPMACVVDNTNKARLSLLATDLMTGEDVHLGMDHQAIVWCHNLLRPAVRTILHALVQARDKSAMERVQWVQSRLDPAMTTNFADRVKHQRETLVVRTHRRHASNDRDCVDTFFSFYLNLNKIP